MPKKRDRVLPKPPQSESLTAALQKMDQEKVLDLRVWLRAFLVWVEEGNCWIDDRDSGIERQLRLNWVQRDIMFRMIRQADRGVPIRLIVPKARKQGVSTLIQSLFVFLCSYIPNYKATTYAHTAQDTLEIFKIARKIHDKHSQSMGIDDSDESRQQLKYSHGSFYTCRTAGGKGSGRGGTQLGLHLSELASMQSKAGLDHDALQGLLNAVAMQPHTIIVIESTGLGPSGEFYDRCMRAADGKGDYELCFYPWYRDPGYQLAAPDDFKLTPYEAGLKNQFNLTDDQLYWRRKKRESESAADEGSLAEIDFKREFPSSLEECFEASRGRVYQSFSRTSHVAEIEIRPHWQLYRAVDWGWTVDPFVCLWIAHDPKAPPGLRVHPSCVNTIREVIAYEMNPQTDQPMDENNHCPDALRYAVVTAKLRGFVYVYREFYQLNAARLGLSGLARKIHELSGWQKTEGTGRVDLATDLGLYVPGAKGEKIELTICDRSQPEAHMQFTRWGLLSTGHKKPQSKGGGSKGEIRDGIFEVDTLVRGEVYFDSPYFDTEAALFQSAATKLYGHPGRVIALTDAEQQAWDRYWAEGDEFSDYGPDWQQAIADM